MRRLVPLVLLGLLAGCESFQEGDLGGQTAPGGRSELTRATFDWVGRTFGSEPAPTVPPAPAVAPVAAVPASTPPSPAPRPAIAAAPAPRPVQGGSDYDATLGVYRPLALEGQAFAQYEMGRLYENGQGVPRDLATARVWYRRAAAQNDPNAVAALARLDSGQAALPAPSGRPALALVSPTGPAPALAPAEPPPQPVITAPLGAMQGPAAAPAAAPPDGERIVPPPPAPPMLARAPTVLEPIRPPESYADGIAAFNARDYAAAAHIWEPLARDGDPNSQTRMGYLSEHGLGVTQDSAKAAEWYRLAAEQDDPAGAFNLGVLYRKGLGVPHDDLAARRWYERAARNGHPVAPRVLALMNEAGLGLEPGTPKPPAAN